MPEGLSRRNFNQDTLALPKAQKAPTHYQNEGSALGAILRGSEDREYSGFVKN